MTEDTDEEAKKLLENEISFKPDGQDAPGEVANFEQQENQAERDAD